MDNINWRLLIVIHILLTGIWGIFVKVASDRLSPPTMFFIVSTIAWLPFAAIAFSGLDFQNKTGAWLDAVCGLMGSFLVAIFYNVLKQAPA